MIYHIRNSVLGQDSIFPSKVKENLSPVFGLEKMGLYFSPRYQVPSGHLKRNRVYCTRASGPQCYRKKDLKLQINLGSESQRRRLLISSSIFKRSHFSIGRHLFFSFSLIEKHSIKCHKCVRILSIMKIGKRAKRKRARAIVFIRFATPGGTVSLFRSALRI